MNKFYIVFFLFFSPNLTLLILKMFTIEFYFDFFRLKIIF